MTNTVKVWEPGFQAPWHFHPFTVPATILQGELTIDYDRETPIYAHGDEKAPTDRRVYRTGDSFMAVSNTSHTSYKLRSEDLVFIVSWLGSPEASLTTLHKEGD